MQINRSSRRIRLLLVTVVAGAVLIAALGLWVHTFSLIPALFRLNKECQEEGYYMAEFEFKMLGLAYLLDKGHYLKAASGIRNLHRQLQNREGLIKLPEFKDKREEFQFYLSLQNPRTGAFMDDSYPYCTFDGPTGNVLLHLEALAGDTGQPLRLQYPLSYLDAISTPEKLRAFLDDVSRVGWIASQLPQTSFHFARDLLSHCEEGGVLERNDLYRFSPEWKRTLLEWFYENQDPETGFWGPKSIFGSGLSKLDLNNTASIVKAFSDSSGNDIRASFPLRYKNAIFATTLQVMSQPVPDPEDLDEWHEWALKMEKGTALLTRRLWQDVSRDKRARARELFENYIEIVFEKYYVPDEGGFSYYPESHHATLDGTGMGTGCLEKVGAFSAERQGLLWGSPEETITDLGSVHTLILESEDFIPLKNCPNINSWRFYSSPPSAANLTTGASGVFYLEETPVLDIVELVPRVRTWIDLTSQSMGNWVSREGIRERMSGVGIAAVPVWRGAIPLQQLNEILNVYGTVHLIGFDVLQVPGRKITFASRSSVQLD